MCCKSLAVLFADDRRRNTAFPVLGARSFTECRSVGKVRWFYSRFIHFQWCSWLLR